MIESSRSWRWRRGLHDPASGLPPNATLRGGPGRINIQASRESFFRTARFTISVDDRPDRVNMNWPTAWAYLESVGVRSGYIEDMLREALKEVKE